MWAPMDVVVLVVALTVLLRRLVRLDRDRPDGLAGGPPRSGKAPVTTGAATEGMVR